jgi:hypothetical protein
MVVGFGNKLKKLWNTIKEGGKKLFSFLPKLLKNENVQNVIKNVVQATTGVDPTEGIKLANSGLELFNKITSGSNSFNQNVNEAIQLGKNVKNYGSDVYNTFKQKKNKTLGIMKPSNYNSNSNEYDSFSPLISLNKKNK